MRVDPDAAAEEAEHEGIAERSAGAEPTMAELMAEVEREGELRPLRSGDTVEGTVAAISGDEVLVDLRGGADGVLSLREAGEPLEVGERVLAYVVQAEDRQGHAVLSLRKARRERRWRELAQQRETGDLIDAEVVDVNRGGAVVDVGLRGFVPLSQLTSVGRIEREADGGEIPAALHALRGRRLALKVIEVDEDRDRLILSEKSALQEQRRRRKAHAVAELKPGDVLDGTVTHVTGFGIFVDVGVADGLVHRSEVTWDKTVNPTTLHRVGDRVKVLVTAVDTERDRISLSLKRLGADPWDRVGRDFTVGQDLDAEITRLMPFGAFARIADELEGLIHVSELAHQRVSEPSGVVSVGDRVRVRLVAIDPERRRLSLSMRQADGGRASPPILGTG